MWLTSAVYNKHEDNAQNSVAVFSFVSIEISCHLSSTIMLW